MRREASGFVRHVAVGLLACASASVAQEAPLPAPAPAGSVAPPAVAPPADIPFVAADAAYVRTPSAPNAWGGPRTGNDPTLSDRVVSYRIQARLDAARHAVDGRQQLTWRNRSDRSVGAVFLHLYLNAFEGEGSLFFTERRLLADDDTRGLAQLKKGEWGYIDLGTVEQDGAPLTWRYVHPDGGPDTDHTVVRVDLARPVPPGGSVSLDMAFHAQLPKVVVRTGHVGDFNLVAQWFPKIGVLELPGERGATQPRWNVHAFHFNSEFYADFGDYDVRLSVPKDYVVAAVGEQQGPPVIEGAEATWHFAQGDVHDFAWMAAPGYLARETTWSGPGSPPVKVKVVYPPDYAHVAGPVLKAATDSLTWFSDTLGPYPYRTVTAVVPPFNADEAGGMEYPTFFTVDHARRVDAGTLDQYLIDFVTIHEFGHGYFYGLLASNEFEEPMLDEGLNEFWDDRMLRARDQRVHLTRRGWRLFGIDPAVDVFSIERMGAALGAPADPLGQNAWDRLSSDGYGTVYSRTATAMHDLEARLGKPVLEKAFRQYYATWHFRHPAIGDLQQVLSDVSGQPAVIADVFEKYVYGTARIDDRVTGIDSVEVLPLAGSSVRDGERIDIGQDVNDAAIARQREAWARAHPNAKEGTGPFPWRTTVTVWRDGASVPQILRVTFADGSTDTVPWNDDRRWARFTLTRGVQGVSAELDPQGAVLLDANKLNDSRTVEPNHAASTRWSADIAALLQGLYTWLGTL
ncbi:M1 family metallopeptidase [Luteibacter sp. PPL552]